MNDLPAPDVLLRASNVRFERDGKRILDGVDIDVARGRITAIIGPTACGKTTLLRIFGGQSHPDAGSVTFDGVDVHAVRRRELYRLRKRMGMLFQAQALLTDLSVFDNVAFPLREHTALPESMIRDVVLIKLEAVGLRGARDLYPGQLSGGMSRRVALARAIAMDPELVMYDEPFAGQDPITLGVLMRLVRTVNDALGLTAIVVSHSVDEVLAVSDHVYVLGDGKIQDGGAPDAIRRSKSPYVQQFLSGADARAVAA